MSAQSRRKPSQAEKADRHKLYEKAVQDPEVDVDFLVETYEELRGREPDVMREDFCGTAIAACEWAQRSRDCRAIGVDLDGEVLNWGRENRLARIPADAQRRVELIEGDVLSVETEPADVIFAMNFSYWTFHTRDLLRRYFRNVLRGLRDDGIFICDVFGGYDAMREMTERRDCGKFTYIWDQADYDPVSGRYLCHIHFAFPDGSKLNQAFSYDWRLWTLPEIRELLEEAGFRKNTVYWQGTDEDGEGDGIFTPCERGDADPAWIAYIVAEK